jgi:hypothetical protein
MRNKAILLITLLIASGSVLAEDLLGNAGEQLLKEKATSAIPQEAVKGVETTNQKLEDAKNLKAKVPTSTDAATKALKSKAQEEATQKTLDLLK